ncbi:PH-like domain-containing protein [Frigoribacterium salinisoli]
MTQWLIAALGAAGVAALLALMVLAWRGRGRRQADVPAPEPAPADLGPARLEVDGAYVATTRGDDPLDRVVVHGLGFRGRAVVSVHDAGVRLEIAGVPAFVVPAPCLRDVRRATWTIDRVVERDGLVLLAWTLGGTPVDTYLRLPDDPRPFLEAVRPLLPEGGRRPGRSTAAAPTTPTDTDTAAPGGHS